MRRAILRLLGVLVGALAGACAPPQEDPSTVKDLRVLGMQFEPPEVLLSGCSLGLLQQVALSGLDGGAPDPQVFARLLSSAIQPVAFRALIADPAGAGRQLNYRLAACSHGSDRTCSNENDFLDLAVGTTTAGELTMPVQLALAIDGGSVSPVTLPDGNPLLLEVLKQDSVRGLGGIRVPVVLELRAEDTGEVIYAQKLMPYVCQLFPEMKQNQQPRLPGVTAKGEAWLEGTPLALSGRDEIDMEPLDFSDRLESYLVPSVQLQPVQLTEAWKVAHFTTMGTLSPYETGGIDLGGNVSRANFGWKPKPGAEAQDVTFWFVVRDGRGGQSWLTRTVQWAP